MPSRIRCIVAFLVLALLLAGQVAIGQDKAKDKDAKDKDAKKDTKDKGTPFKVVSVDAAKKTAVVKGADGKSQTLKIGDDVQFIGPRGGVSKEGIKDDRFGAGADVSIVFDKAGKVVKEIHLPYRKTEAKDKDKPKDKDGKDKPKDAKDKDAKDKPKDK